LDERKTKQDWGYSKLFYGKQKVTGAWKIGVPRTGCVFTDVFLQNKVRTSGIAAIYYTVSWQEFACNLLFVTLMLKLRKLLLFRRLFFTRGHDWSIRQGLGL